MSKYRLSGDGILDGVFALRVQEKLRELPGLFMEHDTRVIYRVLLDDYGIFIIKDIDNDLDDGHSPSPAEMALILETTYWTQSVELKPVKKLPEPKTVIIAYPNLYLVYWDGHEDPVMITHDLELATKESCSEDYGPNSDLWVTTLKHDGEQYKEV